MPIFCQVASSVKTTSDYGPKKSIGCHFSDFSQEITAVIPIFCQSNVHSKNKLLSYPYIIKKRQFFQKHGALTSLFLFFMKNPQLSYPYLVKKKVNSVRTTTYYGPKKSIGCHFSPIFHEKIARLMPIFCKKKGLLSKSIPLSCP